MAEVFFCDIPADSVGTHSLESLAAQNFTKQVLSEKLNVRPESIEFERTEFGRPFVRDCQLHFSWSHSGGKIMLAVSKFEVGADIQLAGVRRQQVEKRIFSQAEREIISNAQNSDSAFYSLWVLKESYLKAIGTGFRSNAKEIEFSSIEPQVVSNRHFCSFVLNKSGAYLSAVCELTNKH